MHCEFVVQEGLRCLDMVEIGLSLRLWRLDIFKIRLRLILWGLDVVIIGLRLSYLAHLMRWQGMRISRIEWTRS